MSCQDTFPRSAGLNLSQEGISINYQKYKNENIKINTK